MHDRRVSDEILLFGNAGGLYKNAMTWWDHTTNSIWSQPTGEVIGGELIGTKLQGLPFLLTTWANWQTLHPDTLVLENDIQKLGAFRDRFSTDFLIGVELGDDAKAYAFADVLTYGLIEDTLGSIPILIWGEGDEYRVYLRQAGNVTLHFKMSEGNLVDRETGTAWNPRRGIGTSGELAGQALQQVPSFSIWEQYWFDFFPDGEIFQGN